jgi:hypothetical protein
MTAKVCGTKPVRDSDEDAARRQGSMWIGAFHCEKVTVTLAPCGWCKMPCTGRLFAPT